MKAVLRADCPECKLSTVVVLPKYYKGDKVDYSGEINLSDDFSIECANCHTMITKKDTKIMR